MGWLATLFGQLFTSVAALVGVQTAAKSAYIAAAIAAMFTLTAALVYGIQQSLLAIFVALPSWLSGAGYFLPPNLAAVFGALLSAKICRWVYDYHLEQVRMAVSAST